MDKIDVDLVEAEIEVMFALEELRVSETDTSVKVGELGEYDGSLVGLSLEKISLKTIIKSLKKIIENIIFKIKIFIKKFLIKLTTFGLTLDTAIAINDKLKNFKKDKYDDIIIREEFGNIAGFLIAATIIKAIGYEDLLKYDIILKNDPADHGTANNVSDKILKVLKSFDISLKGIYKPTKKNTHFVVSLVGASGTSINLLVIDENEKRNKVVIDLKDINENVLVHNIDLVIHDKDLLKKQIDKVDKIIDIYQKFYNKTNTGEMTEKEEVSFRKKASIFLSSLMSALVMVANTNTRIAATTNRVSSSITFD